jgi:hypothetical protein
MRIDVSLPARSSIQLLVFYILFAYDLFLLCCFDEPMSLYVARQAARR